MPKKAEDTRPSTIWVRAAPEMAGRVALWERHPDHPAGEVYIAGDGLFEVAKTGEVLARLRKKTLIEVEAPTEEELREVRERESAARDLAPPIPPSSETGAQHTQAQTEQGTRRGTGRENPATKTP